MPNFFALEVRDTYYGNEFRFVSLYNGARGPWCASKVKAEHHGRKHAKIVVGLLIKSREAPDADDKVETT